MADLFAGITLNQVGKRYVEELKKLQQMEVHVGFQEGEADYQDGTSLVEVAAANEFGTSDIPARPFMKQAFEKHKNELLKLCQAEEAKIADGKSTAEKVCKVAGAAAKGHIQQEINDGEFVPNAPYTIKKKGSDHPLIDTGHMRQSVNFIIKKKGGRA